MKMEQPIQPFNSAATLITNSKSAHYIIIYRPGNSKTDSTILQTRHEYYE